MHIFLHKLYIHIIYISCLIHNCYLYVFDFRNDHLVETAHLKSPQHGCLNRIQTRMTPTDMIAWKMEIS